ncbi:MAG: hypothetical protein HY290_11525 [Planctomycetia bacterium]|nr:hypothetical protein [Planctomycetia bacterium]
MYTIIRKGAASRSLLAGGIILLAAAGCSNSVVEERGYVVPAQGTLMYQGQPVADAQLTFLGDDASEPAIAVTDAQGKFRCTTNDSSEGVRPGEYLVTVKGSRGGIPTKYSAAETSTLKVTVEDADENVLRLVLED